MEVEFFSTLANGMMACAAIAGAIAAFKGLNTWKNQSLWHADSELAKRVLLAVYTFRDSLYSVRHPVMSASEMELTTDECQGIVAGNDRSAGVINAYAKRWERHSEKSRELDALLLEADVVWDNTLRTRVDALKQLERELYLYIGLHIDAHHRGDTDLAEDYRDILGEERDILYDNLSDTDEFRADFEAAMGPVEGFLKTKLGRK